VSPSARPSGTPCDQPRGVLESKQLAGGRGRCYTTPGADADVAGGRRSISRPS
jgi:hypothetical protein